MEITTVMKNRGIYYQDRVAHTWAFEEEWFSYIGLVACYATYLCSKIPIQPGRLDHFLFNLSSEREVNSNTEER